MRLIIFLWFFSSVFAAQIRLGNEVLTIEIARTHETRSRGLMGRTELSEGKGMLFIYEESKRLVFWMKNTPIPLSIGFFDEDKTLINILDMDPPIGNIFIRYRSRAPALYALEVPQGWFEKHGIQIGTKFSFLDQEDAVE